MYVLLYLFYRKHKKKHKRNESLLEIHQKKLEKKKKVINDSLKLNYSLLRQLNINTIFLEGKERIRERRKKAVQSRSRFES